MKTINKLIITMAIIVTSLFTFTNTALAMETWDEMKAKADAFITKGEEEGGSTIISDDSLQNFAMPIARMLVTIATVVLVVVTVVMGIQYALSNPADKAKLKQRLIGLVVATIVVFGAQGIWAMLYQYMTSIAK